MTSSWRREMLDFGAGVCEVSCERAFWPFSSEREQIIT